MEAPNLEAVEALDAATIAEDASAPEVTPAEDIGEGSPPEPTGSDEPGTKGEGNEFQSILDESGISVEQLKELVDSDKSLKDLLGDRKLEDVLEKAGKLEEYESQWKIDDEAKKREDETPEDTIARLDQQIADSNTKQNNQESASREKVEADEALSAYDTNVESVISSNDIPDSHKAFLKGILQSSNPAMSVDISNKADVGKMVKEMVSQLKSFNDGVIKDYTDGKGGILPISPSAPSSSDGKGNQPKTIAEATRGVVEKLLRRK